MLISLIKTVAAIVSTNNVQFRQNTLFDIIYINVLPELKNSEHISDMLEVANCNFTKLNAEQEIYFLKNNDPVRKHCDDLGLEATALVKYFESNFSYDLPFRYVLSHKVCFFRMASLNTSVPVLVLEDHVDFSCSFVVDIEKALPELPEEWDILLVHGLYTPTYKSEGSGEVSAVQTVKSSVGFLVNGSKSAKKMNAIMNQKWNDGIPLFKILSQEAQNKAINIYALNKHVVSPIVYFPEYNYQLGAIRLITFNDSITNFIRHGEES